MKRIAEMRNRYWMNMLLIIFVMVLAGIPARAEAPLSDPGIPDGEKITYNLYLDDVLTKLTENTIVKQEGKIYEIISRSKSENSEMRIFKNTMMPFYFHTVTKEKGLTLDVTTRVEGKSTIEEDEIIVFDFSDLNYVLRGFPFDEPRDIKIAMLEKGGGDENESSFEIKVKLIKKEELKLKGRNIDCYKLGISVSATGIIGILSRLYPKTYFWYSTESPHYLVRFEGPGGGPGSPKKIMELIDYSIE